MKRRIAVVLTTRGNYAKLRSTMRALLADPRVELQVAIGGALVLPRYGDFAPLLERDGIAVAERLFFLVEGETPEAIAQSAGLAVASTAAMLARLKPDVVVAIADRFEVLSIAQAALCLNVAIAHLEGGEVSGSIDERIRHAVTKLSHLHFVANEEAAERVRRLGEWPETVFAVGTPSLDMLAELDLDDGRPAAAFLDRAGEGAPIDLARDYVVVSQHAVPTEIERVESQIAETAAAVRALGLPAVWVLPNVDAGGAAVAAATDRLLAAPGMPPIRRVGSVPFAEYAVLLRRAKCLVGNTSSGIREAAYLGVPAVNVGTRQTGRQRGRNVIDVGHDRAAIETAARRQIAHGRYPSDPVYGDGHAGAKIAEILATAPLAIDKTIAY